MSHTEKVPQLELACRPRFADLCSRCSPYSSGGKKRKTTTDPLSRADILVAKMLLQQRCSPSVTVRVHLRN